MLKQIKFLTCQVLSVLFMLVIAVGLFAPVTQSVSINDLSIIDVKCLFEGEPKDYSNPTDKCTANESLVSRIINFLASLAIPLAIVVIMWGGYQYFIGGVDGKSSGQKAIQSAVIGLVIVTLAQFFVNSIFKGPTPVINNQGVLNPVGIISFLGVIRNLLVQLAGAIAILVIIYGGYKYFFSGLDWEKEDGAKSIRNGVIGLLIVFLASAAFDLASKISSDIVAAGGSNTGGDILSKIINELGLPILNNLTDAFLTMASIVAILVIIYGGYKYFFAGVDFAKEDGLKNIRNGVIGLVAVLLAKAVVALIQLILPAVKNGVADPNFNFTPGNLFQVQPLLTAAGVLIGQLLIPASSAFALFFLVLGAWFWITSNGDEKQIDKARKAVRNSVIGLIILLLSATMVQFVAFIAQNVNLKP